MDDNAFSLDNEVRLNVVLEQLINKDGDDQQDSDEDVQVDNLIEISDVETNSGKHNDDIYNSMDDPMYNSIMIAVSMEMELKIQR